VALAVWIAGPAGASSQQPSLPALGMVLERAGSAVQSLERELGSVVADERLVQRASKRGQPASRRELRSDLLLVRLPDQDGWLPFRDVYEVDGRVVRDRSERLQRLFLDAPNTALPAAARINSESSRYNIGAVTRTINTPTFGLMLLRPAYAARFEFKKRGEERIAQQPVWHVTFTERARPTVVRTLRNDDVPIEGSVWIEPESGRVVKTLVKTIGTPDPGSFIVTFVERTLLRVEVFFAPSDSLGFWVPVRMTEWAQASDRSVVEGTATYTRFRRFTVNTAESFEPPASDGHDAGTASAKAP
jgi:hypothetical protein